MLEIVIAHQIPFTPRTVLQSTNAIGPSPEIVPFRLAYEKKHPKSFPVL